MSIRHWAVIAGAVLVSACSETAVPDFNNSTEGQFLNLTNRTQIQQLATGLLDVDRRTHDFQILLNETIARDVFRFDAAETRYITQPLGVGSMSATVFVGQGVYNGPYRAIRSAQNMITAINAAPEQLPSFNGGAQTPFTANDKRAVIGYAQTIKALSYMRLIEQRDTLGIARFTDPATINPIQCKENVLTHIAAILDSADADLTAGATEFAFDLPAGWEGFDTPATFRQFERGLRAKVAYYQAFDLFARTGGADPAASTARTINAAALTAAEQALAASFYTAGGDNTKGVYYTYFSASGDYQNPNFNPAIYRINSKVVREAEGTVTTVAGSDTTYTVLDQRVRNKVDLTISAGDCVSISNASSCFQDKVNATNTTRLALLRQDELALIRAQIHWGRGQYQQALDIVNGFRSAAGFTVPMTLAGTFGGADTAAEQDALMKEILRQKRYQLLFESPSRLVDFRMFGFLGDFGPERGNQPIPVFPHPLAESQARGGDLSQVCN
jgi:hypothetical protein